MRASLALSALRNAIALRDPSEPPDTVVDSDRGAPFRAASYSRVLHDHGLTGWASLGTALR